MAVWCGEEQRCHTSRELNACRKSARVQEKPPPHSGAEASNEVNIKVAVDRVGISALLG